MAFDKDIKYCEKTGEHHRWHFKKHGKRNFPTKCADCGIEAEKVQEGIDAQAKEAETKAKKEDDEKLKRDTENDKVKKEKITS